MSTFRCYVTWEQASGSLQGAASRPRLLTGTGSWAGGDSDGSAGRRVDLRCREDRSARPMAQLLPQGELRHNLETRDSLGSGVCLPSGGSFPVGSYCPPPRSGGTLGHALKHEIIYSISCTTVTPVVQEMAHRRHAKHSVASCAVTLRQETLWVSAAARRSCVTGGPWHGRRGPD